MYNQLGLKDKATLERIESAITYIKSYELMHMPIGGGFDLGHMKETP